MFRERRIWHALDIFAILVSAFVTLYAGFFVPNAFTEKQLQSSLPVTTEITAEISELWGLGDRIKLSMIVDQLPVKNLVVSIISVKNTGSIAIVPSDFFTPLSINVDKQWKIFLLVSKSTGGGQWKMVNDQQVEMSPELLNPGDTIFVVLFLTNTQYEHLTLEQTEQLRPLWSAHILNLKSITTQTNPLKEPQFFPFILLLGGPTLLVTLLGAIFFMTIYVNLLYNLDYIRGIRWQSVGAIVGVGIISVISSEAMATYLFPNIYVFLTGGISTWLNMPWIVLNLVLLVWLSWKAWKARAILPLDAPSTLPEP
jgi:hypothetical protein